MVSYVLDYGEERTAAPSLCGQSSVTAPSEDITCYTQHQQHCYTCDHKLPAAEYVGEHSIAYFNIAMIVVATGLLLY